MHYGCGGHCQEIKRNQMFSNRIIFEFVLKALIFYGILLAIASMGFGNRYAEKFITVGNKIAKSFSHLGLVVQFQEKGEKKRKFVNIVAE